MFQHHIFNAFSSAGSYSCFRTSSKQLLASDCRFFRKMALPQEVIDRIAAFFVPADMARIMLTSSHMLELFLPIPYLDRILQISLADPHWGPQIYSADLELADFLQLLEFVDTAQQSDANDSEAEALTRMTVAILLQHKVAALAPPDAVIPSAGGCRSPQGTENVAMVEFTHQLVP